MTFCCSEDLAGLKVGHDFEGLGEGEDRVLTLKDSRILDDEGSMSLIGTADSKSYNVP